MAEWPIDLPAPLVSGYAIAPLDQTVRTEMEAGNTKVRRRTFARRDTINCSASLTISQFNAFRTWFEDAVDGANGGAGWFTVSLLTGTSDGFANVEARFSSPWTVDTDGKFRVKISMSLEVRYA